MVTLRLTLCSGVWIVPIWWRVSSPMHSHFFCMRVKINHSPISWYAGRKRWSQIPYLVARICEWGAQVSWSGPAPAQKIHAQSRSSPFRWRRRSCRWRCWRAGYSCRQQTVVSNVVECHSDLPQAESWLPKTVKQTNAEFWFNPFIATMSVENDQ